MAHPTSFRLPPELLARIDGEAAERGITVTALVTSLLDEGLKTRAFPGIVYRDGPTGRGRRCRSRAGPRAEHASRAPPRRVRWLLDEMLPPATALALRALGHDATSVRDAGLTGATDTAVMAYVIDADRIVVTENVADFATLLSQWLARHEQCVPVVFVRRERRSTGGALPDHLARVLDEWARANPTPYLGLHWVGP
ncbi:MAG: DUF5615 family PIN-like protein [Chloroflexi bacterium]|nr:DUF5615 family PIN-like protein [Chloroflexota bacterium]